MSWYLDSSAVLKLLIDEKESVALTGFIDFQVTSSALTRVEVIRTLHKIAPEKVEEAKVLLKGFDVIPINTAVLNIAESFNSSITLRSLDALHVATVLFLEKTVNGLISFDKALIENARQLGIKTISPGIKI